MKILNPTQIDNLLNTLDEKPKQNIVHFSESSHLLTKKLQQFCKKIDTNYYLYCTKNVFYDKSTTKYKNQAHIHIFHFELLQPSYLLQDIVCDYLIVTLNFTKVDKTAFLKKCHPLLKKGGKIIIFTPNSTDKAREAWKDTLTAQHYSATTINDTLFDDYEVIVSKTNG